MAFQISPSVNVTEIDLSTVIPAVSTTEAGIAGVFNWGPVEQLTLVTSKDDLAAKFGRPNSNNYETFYTAGNFLDYGNKLYVSRAISTTGSANSYNAVANNGSATALFQVKNLDSYELQQSTIEADGGAQFLAKYPSSLGNSLKISVCDSINAYSSAHGPDLTSDCNMSVKFTPGSNVALLTVTSAANGVLANTVANSFISAFTVGDYIVGGNNTVGRQYMKITQFGAVAQTGVLFATANIHLGSNFNLSVEVDKLSELKTATFGANSTSLSIGFGGNTGLIVGGAVTGAGIQSGTVVDSVSGNTVTISLPTTQAGTSAVLAFNAYQRFWEFFNVVDKAPGTSQYVSDRNSGNPVDELHVVVVDRLGRFTGVNEQILEVFPAVSRASDSLSPQGGSLYYKNILNNNSRYVWWGDDRSGASDAVSTAVTTSTNVKPYTANFVNGADGNPESSVAVSDMARAWDKFKSTEDVDVSLLLAGKAIGTNYVQMANYLIENIAEYRKDCMVLISPNLETVLNNLNPSEAVTSFRRKLTSSSYWVMDSGYKYQYDKYNDINRWIPLNGDIAGIMARTDNIRDPWFSPAGFNRGSIKNVIKLAYNPDQANRDIIYKVDVNPVVSFPGQGPILYGDKTGLGKPSAFDRINVRRLFIVLEKAIATAAKFTLFEFNDEFTRAQFRNLVEPFLRDVLGRRGIYDFRVVCDETNNTPEVIDGNRFVGDIYIKPAKSINYIQLNFVAVRTGVSFEEIVGRF